MAVRRLGATNGRSMVVNARTWENLSGGGSRLDGHDRGPYFDLAGRNDFGGYDC